MNAVWDSRIRNWWRTKEFVRRAAKHVFLDRRLSDVIICNHRCYRSLPGLHVVTLSFTNKLAIVDSQFLTVSLWICFLLHLRSH